MLVVPSLRQVLINHRIVLKVSKVKGMIGNWYSDAVPVSFRPCLVVPLTFSIRMIDTSYQK